MSDPITKLKNKYETFEVYNPSNKPLELKLFGDSVMIMAGAKASVPSALFNSLPPKPMTISNVSMADMIEVGFIKKGVDPNAEKETGTTTTSALTPPPTSQVAPTPVATNSAAAAPASTTPKTTAPAQPNMATNAVSASTSDKK